MDSEKQTQAVGKRPVQLQLKEGTLTASLSGEIDHHTAREIREEIDLVLMRVHPGHLVMDFADVQFMDSSGIGLILGRCKLMQVWQGKVSICHMPPKLERLISLAGLSELCEVQKEETKHENVE
ncbi:MULTISPECIES: STAS domain-containing protein [Caproicibacterium]|jgi:stage II sporulation protein AA (anti-sigma F factor antagonist)|uniref:Anti-sigma factor antagonist n=1 Tax=Caproicibacterium lactatifermentans TaxID=2666138 RepID=A0A859DRJ1_9FIRM|nr:anti-sigma factor antagonist [Caproicibacterium lactatifermentans]ARP49973.1 hypothetical protein B6259_03160 [Ruminococcaceae bacterium CPB6]MDD4808111.1 anti-sigma factor antagonist [Oscillospiraceae bacterium]QKN24306.1 anti-sigma factor antagonist [Caproicibacterium lactatifermentans]QKO30680.1 anti-sigma factor antagonist [Caproicibacterium lactatifermentans]